MPPQLSPSSTTATTVAQLTRALKSWERWYADAPPPPPTEDSFSLWAKDLRMLHKKRLYLGTTVSLIVTGVLLMVSGLLYGVFTTTYISVGWKFAIVGAVLTVLGAILAAVLNDLKPWKTE